MEININKLPHPDYMPYPRNQTVGFYPSREKMAQAIEELLSQGFDEEDLNIFEGEQGLHAIDVEGSEHTFFEYLARKSQKFWGSGEWAFFEEANQELKKGHALLSVYTEDEAEKDIISAIMKRHGAYDIRYFARAYTERILK